MTDIMTTAKVCREEMIRKKLIFIIEMDITEKMLSERIVFILGNIRERGKG